MEDVREYLHLYIGQKVRYKYIDWAQDSWTPWATMTLRDVERIRDDMSVSMFEVALRRLDSMTEDEDNEFRRINGYWIDEHWTANGFKWLLSKGFWLFDDSAFDKGLIIDSKTLNK